MKNFLPNVALLVVASQITLTLPHDKMLASPKPSDFVAMVNGKSLTAQEFERILWDWYGYGVVQEVIGSMIVSDEAEREGVTVTDEEIAAEMDQAVAPFKKSIPPGWTLEDTLRAVPYEYGGSYSFSHLYNQARTRLLVRKMVLRGFKPEELRLLAQIVIKPKDFSEAARKEARLLAENVVAMARAGEGWLALVERYSQDETTKASGGRLGWIAPNDMYVEIRAAASDAKAGDIIGPYEVPAGVVVVRVEGVGPPPQNELEVARNVYLQRATQEFYEGLRKKATYENKLAPPIKPN